MPDRDGSEAELTLADVDEAADVLCEAFADYPVMRFVVGDAGQAYVSHVRRLTRFFVLARLWGNGLVEGVRATDGHLMAVATIVTPGQKTPAPELTTEREAMWSTLGADARARYEHYGVVSGRHLVQSPHYHLAMIGVRRAHTGRGLARRLLDALHDRSRRDPGSSGVTLNTEDPRNVPLYEHVGYRIIGREQIPGAFDVWSLYRADDTPVTSIGERAR